MQLELSYFSVRIEYMDNQEFLKRINYQGDIKYLLSQICSDYYLGEYSSHKIIKTGYEDCNIILATSKDSYFVKIFGDFRTKGDCIRYIDLMVKVVESGVNHPKLYKNKENYLYEFKNPKGYAYLCVMELVDGDSFYDLQINPSAEEIINITKQASIINSIDLRPPFTYDSWAIPNFLLEYEKIKEHFTPNDINLLQPLISKFKNFDLDILPHCFVHSDLIKTNVMKSRNGQIYLIDFSVANYYPRIQELAVLLCNLFFDKNNFSNYRETYDTVLSVYQERIKLQPIEINTLPFFIKLAHAMHIVGATKEKIVNKNDSQENYYWLDFGRVGLKFMNEQF